MIIDVNAKNGVLGVAFYMIFGGQDIAGYQRFDLVMYTLVRMTLVDDYNYEAGSFWNSSCFQMIYCMWEDERGRDICSLMY